MSLSKACAKQRQLLISEGCEFFKDNRGNLRYLGFYRNKRTKRILRAALRWEVLAFPKREPSFEDHVQVVDLDPIRKTFAASVSYSKEVGVIPELARGGWSSGLLPSRLETSSPQV
jgi:hypothetical protein